MAAKGSNASKTILMTLAALAAFGLLCCGGVWFLWLEPLVTPGIELGKSMVAMTEAMPETLGPGAQFQPFQRADQDIVLLFGVAPHVGLTPEKVAELQDAAWKVYAESFATSGGVPFVSALAIGHAAGSPEQPKVTDWKGNDIAVDELAQRTGIAAPPPSAYTEMIENLEKTPGVKVKIETDDGSGDASTEDER